MPSSPFPQLNTVAAPLRVFVSYAHDDALEQRQLRDFAHRLGKSGVEVTFDLDWPTPLEGWRQWLEREVAAADAVLVVTSPAYPPAFTAKVRLWPGPVVPAELYHAQARYKPFLTAGFSMADAAHRPEPMTHQTFFLLETDGDFHLLLRTLGGLPKQGTPGNSPTGRPISPLPELDRLLKRHSRATEYAQAGLAVFPQQTREPRDCSR